LNIPVIPPNSSARLEMVLNGPLFSRHYRQIGSVDIEDTLRAFINKVSSLVPMDRIEKIDPLHLGLPGSRIGSTGMKTA
jgi:hypothetical protein